MFEIFLFFIIFQWKFETVVNQSLRRNPNILGINSFTSSVLYNLFIENIFNVCFYFHSDSETYLFSCHGTSKIRKTRNLIWWSEKRQTQLKHFFILFKYNVNEIRLCHGSILCFHINTSDWELTNILNMSWWWSYAV